MKNININSNALDDIINLLEEDNNNIVEIIKNANTTLRNLNQDNWNSPEKNKLDNTFNSYMYKTEDQIADYLNEYTDFLKKVNKTYRMADLKMKNKMQEIDAL